MLSRFNKLHHHGKTMYKHAQKHHKKYLLGVAGFFGLFKLFSFLVLGISGYVATQSYTEANNMAAFNIENTTFHFFIGDENCNQQKMTTDAALVVYACVTGSALENIKTMRFSMSSEKDLKKQDRGSFVNATPLKVSGESIGMQYIYAQYGYSEKTFTTVSDTIDVANFSEGKVDIAGKTILNGESFPINGMYRVIQSSNDKSNITINTLGSSGTIQVSRGDWYGMLSPPTIVSDDREAVQAKGGLPDKFIPQSTWGVGANGVSLNLDNKLKFGISLQMSEDLPVDTLLDIYYSADGNIRETLVAQCTIDQEHMCTFQSSSLGLFTVGTNDTSLLENTSNFITQKFRENNPSDQDIIHAMFGQGESTSIYTAKRKENTCVDKDISVVFLTPGTNTIPKYLDSNTVYVLEKGTYISRYMTEITGSCVGMIGIETGVKLFTKNTRGANIKISGGKNNILTNFNIYGENDGEGGTHSGNNYGIFLDTPDNTINKINAYSYLGFGIYMENFANDVSNIHLYSIGSLVIYPQYDTYIDAKQQDNNYGKSETLVANGDGSKILMSFNLTNIPKEAKISNVELDLTKVSGKSDMILIKRILNNNWIAGRGVGDLALYGEPNYRYLSYSGVLRYGGTEGLMVGQDYDIQDMIHIQTFDKKNKSTPFNFNDYGLATIKEWIQYPELNRGLVIISDGDTIKLGSQENTNFDYRPQLNISYTSEGINRDNMPVVLPQTTDQQTITDIMIDNGYRETGEVVLGSKPIDVSLSEGSLPIAITMESVDGETTVAMPGDIQIKTEDGSEYTGVINGPKDISIVGLSDKIQNQDIIKAFKIGSDDKKLFIKDSKGKAQKVNIRVPISGYDVESEISISYSSDGEIFTSLGTTKVQEKDGNIYVQFQTDHFTNFVLGKKNCSFTINNDDVSTNTGIVSLYSVCSSANRVRFANTETELDSASWMSFTSIFTGWNLVGNSGTNRVFAEFDEKNNGRKTEIVYDDIELVVSPKNTGDVVVLPVSGSTLEEIANTMIVEGNFIKGTGALSPISSDTLVGEKALDFSKSKGKLLQPTLLKSKAKHIEVKFPIGVIVKTKGEDFTGIIMLPEYISGIVVPPQEPITGTNNSITGNIITGSMGTTTGEVATGGVETGYIPPSTTIVLGDPNTPMDFQDENGNPKEVEVMVELTGSKQKTGFTIIISSSQDGENRSFFKTGKVEDLGDGSLGVKFTTSHFTHYNLSYSMSVETYSPVIDSWIASNSIYFSWYLNSYYSIQYQYLVIDDLYYYEPGAYTGSIGYYVYSLGDGYHYRYLTITDIYNNYGQTQPEGFYVDTTAPVGGAVNINNNEESTSSSTVTLYVTCPSDTGYGGVQFAYGNTTTPTNRANCPYYYGSYTTVSHTLTAGGGTKTVYVRFKDGLENTTSAVSDSITVSSGSTSPEAPICTASQIFGPGSLAVSCTQTDGTIKYTTDGSNPTCESSTRSNQSFSNTTTLKVGQCDIEGIFSMTPNTYTYTLDNTAPTFTFVNTAGNECVTGSLEITVASDGTGVGLTTGTAYSFNGTTWGASTSTGINAQQVGLQLITGRVRDTLGNSSWKTATYTFNDVVPTASNFIGHASVGNTARTVDWKVLSSAAEGACQITDIVYSGIVSQGTKGVCSVVGNNITYTPNANQSGSDTCIVQVKDNENSTVNFIATWNEIDTIKPACTVFSYNPSSGPINTDVTVTCNASEPVTYQSPAGTDIYTFVTNGSYVFNYTDTAGNTGTSTATVSWIDKIAPQVFTAVIYNGNTGNNGATLYYNGTIEIWAPVSDTVGISGTSCEYTTGNIRAPANYSGTATNGYCVKTGLNYTSNITINFRVHDIANNLSTGNSTTYLYDTTIKPIITGINLIPTLSMSYLGYYTVAAIITGNTIVSGAVVLKGINGDGGNCTDYSVSGSCIPDIHSKILTYSGGQIRQATGFAWDDLYPMLSFASSDITRNNAPNNYLMTKNSYALLHVQNPFTMTGNARFRIEVNAYRRNTNATSLSVYVIEKNHPTTYFNSNRLSNTGVELVGSITPTQDFNHIHTINSSHHLIGLTTNSDGTVGNKHLNISTDFWVVLYPDTPSATRGWDLRYQPQSLCDNTNGRYVGTQGTWTTQALTGCPDAHFHIARTTDGVNVVASATYTGFIIGTGIISGFNNFYFSEISNMSPNPTTFILPTPGMFYSGNINITRNPATDPNNDTLIYNIYALSSTGLIIRTLITGTSLTGYTLNKGLLVDSEYGLMIEACDPFLLCSTGYLDSDFFIDTTAPIIIFTGTTPVNATTGTANTFTPQLQITENGIGLNQFIYTFNGTPYSIYDSGLILMYNFDNVEALGENSSVVKDISPYNNTGIINGATPTAGIYGGAYSFNGSNNYIQMNQPTSWKMNSVTVSSWFKTNSSADKKIISSSISHHPLQIFNGHLRTCLSTCSEGNTLINDGNWHFATVVGDDTSIRVYLDGNTIPEITQTAGGSTIINEIFRIGSVGAGVGGDSVNLTFLGSIDEVRIYNRALSVGEIGVLYKTNLNKFTTGQWLFSDERVCMNNGSYIYTGYVSDGLTNNTSTGRKYGISIPIYSLGASPFNLGMITVSGVQQTISGQSFSEFWIQDNIGTGWYTTIQLPLALTGKTYNAAISQSNIRIKGTGVTTLQGTATSSVYVDNSLSSYSTFSGARTYIKKDYSNNPYNCPTGKYGSTPSMEVTIPAWQSPDTYSGIITFDINN